MDQQLNPLQFADEKCKDIVNGYLRHNHLSVIKFPIELVAICLQFYCTHLMQYITYHNVPLLKQLKSIDTPLTDINYFVNKTQDYIEHDKEITLYGSMIIIQQNQIASNRVVTGLNTYNNWAKYVNKKEFNQIKLIFGFNRTCNGGHMLQHLLNHLCLLFYAYRPKTDWSCEEVANWIGSLGIRYTKYMIAFKENEIDGEFMEELIAYEDAQDILQELDVMRFVDRYRIIRTWKKL